MSSITVAAPKSQQVADSIRQRIESGDLQPGDRLLTIRQFAAHYGVSNQVVQRAFTTLSEDGLIESHVGRGTFVAAPPVTREVVSIIEGPGDPHARLPIILPPALQRRGLLSYLLELGATSAGHSRDETRALLESRPFALIVDGCSTLDPTILAWRHPRTRLVVVKRCEHEFGEDAFMVLIDHEAIGYLACQHLLKRGRRRIAPVIFERRPGWTSDLIARGCERALAEAGLEPCRYVVEHRALDYAAALAAGEQPDGLVCHNDYCAVKVLRAAPALGWTVGEDVDVVGHGNTPWAAAYGFPTVDPCNERLVEVVADYLDGPATSGRVYVPPALVTPPFHT